MTEYTTLADLIKVWDDLPDCLRFEIDETKGDKMYESIYQKNLERIFEAKSTRDVMRRFCSKHDKQDWTWENFQKEYGEFIDENDFHSYDFKRELGLIDKGVYKVYDPDAVKGTDVEDADTRKAFDPTEPGADPIMISLYKALVSANNKTDSVAQSVADKYDGLYETARNVASGASLNPHAFICGEPGVGKSYSVEKGIEKGLSEWKPNKKHKNKPKFISRSGSVGTAFTDLLIFFFKNRHEKLILLDDCDGFLVGPSQDINNFMKVLLNSSLKPISSPRTIRANANRQLEKENESIEHKNIHVDTSKLLEGKCSISCGDESFEFDVNLQEAAKIKNVFGFKKHLTEKKTYDPLHQIDKYVERNLGLINESELSDEEEERLEDIERAAEDLGLSNEELETSEQIPDDWIFDSNLILISNLYISDIDDAVISRCDTYQLNLTVPEFFCRAEQILDDLKVGEYSSTNPEVIKWAKREAFAWLKIAVLGSSEFKNVHVPVNVHLDFRFVGNKVTNKFLSRAIRYCRDNNVDLENPENWPKIEMGLRDGFMRDLLKLLQGEEKHK